MPSIGFVIKAAAKLAGLIFLGLLLIMVILGLVPMNTDYLQISHADPAATYADSAAQIQTVIDAELGQVCDVCGTRLYTHGDRTKKAVVLVHGLTNSPRQFQEIGQQLYNDGYNVLIPRLPYHGLRTHTVSELGNTTTEELRQFADETIDMAAGLGDEITVVGLSAGGTVTGWVTQHRSEVKKTVLIAPLYGLHGIPQFGNTFIGNLFARFPDIDFSLSSEPPRESVYLGWSTRGIAEYQVFSRAARPHDDNPGPQVKNIVLVTNGNDHTINADIAGAVVDQWEGAGAKVTRYQFDASLGLPHDVVDITSVGDKSQWIDPILIGLIESD